MSESGKSSRTFFSRTTKRLRQATAKTDRLIDEIKRQNSRKDEPAKADPKIPEPPLADDENERSK